MGTVLQSYYEGGKCTERLKPTEEVWWDKRRSQWKYQKEQRWKNEERKNFDKLFSVTIQLHQSRTFPALARLQAGYKALRLRGFKILLELCSVALNSCCYEVLYLGLSWWNKHGFLDGSMCSFYLSLSALIVTFCFITVTGWPKLVKTRVVSCKKEVVVISIPKVRTSCTYHIEKRPFWSNLGKHQNECPLIHMKLGILHYFQENHREWLYGWCWSPNVRKSPANIALRE